MIKKRVRFVKRTNQKFRLQERTNFSDPFYRQDLCILLTISRPKWLCYKLIPYVTSLLS